MVQARRRAENAAKRAAGRAHREDQRDRALFDRLARRFADRFQIWSEHRGAAVLNDACPWCGELVVITSRESANDYGHRAPVCEMWVPSLTAMGGAGVRFVGHMLEDTPEGTRSLGPTEEPPNDGHGRRPSGDN
jgi:hypothetical protein